MTKEKSIHKSKSRIWISILAVVIVLCLTNRYWLGFISVPIQFDVKGGGNKCKVAVLLNYKDDEEFKKMKHSSQTFDLQKNSHIEMNLRCLKPAKRIKIVLSNLEQNQSISIENLMFYDQKLPIENGEKVRIEGAKLYSKEDFLKGFDAEYYLKTYTDVAKAGVNPQEHYLNYGRFEGRFKNQENEKKGLKEQGLFLKGNTEQITLTYLEPLPVVKKSWEVDYKLLVIIAVFSYLLTVICIKLIDYNWGRKRSVIDVIFLTLLFTCLFFPMSSLNKEEISTQENRTLAKWKSIFLPNGNLNFDFGKDFNEYFNDRFRGREEMVNLYGARMHLQKNFITKDVLKGDDNWLFLGWKKSIDSYTSRILFSEEELKAINMYLSSIDEYCRSNGKKFYFLIAPDKSKIYGEYYPKSLIPRKGMSRTEIMINYIQGHSNVKVIYPKERLLQEKAEGLLYFKHDTHWNSLGAYYGYEELMKEIVLDFSEIQICSIKKDKNVDNFGDLDNMLPEILRVHDSSKYISPEIIEPRAKISYPAIWNEDFTTSENRYGNRNLLMFRDSFTTALIPYLAESFRLCKCQCKHEVKPSLMKDADVIVLEVVERSLPGLVYQHLNLD